MEKQKMKTASAVAAAVLLGAALVFAGCEGPVLDGPASAGSETGIGVSASSASVNLMPGPDVTPGAIGVNEITVTWPPISGATGYDVYYDTINPPVAQFESTAATTVTITGLNGGTTYYVQVIAKDPTGPIDQTGIVDCRTSNSFSDTHFEEFIPYTSTFGDYYVLDETEGYHLTYIMSDIDPEDPEYAGYDVFGDIRYIYHFGNSVPVTITETDGVTTHSFTGAAGVMIIEIDRTVGLDYNWKYLDSGDFVAHYYYGGQLGNSTYTSVQMGFAASPNPEPPPQYGTPCYETLEAAIAASVGAQRLQDKLEEYIKEPAAYY